MTINAFESLVPSREGLSAFVAEAIACWICGPACVALIHRRATTRTEAHLRLVRPATVEAGEDSFQRSRRSGKGWWWLEVASIGIACQCLSQRLRHIAGTLVALLRLFHKRRQNNMLDTWVNGRIEG